MGANQFLQKPVQIDDLVHELSRFIRLSERVHDISHLRSATMVKKRILVVDDDRDFADSIALRCRDIGFDAEIACTPLAAVVSMGARPPDLLCLDVNMPTGNGLDLCEYLVRDANGPPKPVIILTGRTDKGTICRSVLLRARYVRKAPNVWQCLRPVIEELL